ncbi:MAG: hypothetical protein A2Z97_10795 [Bdellovibrionales bacterium GWB1_52_6]|nr:MAG: hypothetical protein A2Z97_10795 [Bdellovibrionales bacterium GWB1_52_6]OFZ03381.1 MAG: hypothetical protein A2X97_05400 [Bdellovibrionales bacterium GWA1_52_35]HCM40964.1 hypothetical protein [Bdellovibrionales bacterium]
MSNTRRAYVYLSLSILIWGASFIATKQALGQLVPSALIAARFTMGYLALVIAGLFLKLPRSSFKREDLPLLLLLTLIEPVIYFLLETWAVQLTVPVNVSLIIALSPLFTTSIAHAFLKEKPGVWFYPALLVSLGGVLLALSQGADRLQLSFGRGELLATLACLLVSGYVLVVRKLTIKYSSYSITRFQMGFTSFVFLLWIGLRGLWQPDSIPDPGGWSVLTWGCVAGLGILSSALAYFCLNFSFSHIPARHVAFGANFIPVITLLISAVLPGGSLRLWQVTGIAIAIAGVWIALRTEKRARVLEITQPLA